MYRHPRTGWQSLYAALLSIILSITAGCARSTPEQVLRVQLQHMQNAANARDPRSFMQVVAEDFRGNEGIDRAAMHNVLRMQFLANAAVGAMTGPATIELHGDKATVQFNVVLTGGSARALPDRVQSYSVTSGWRLDGGEWKVYVAEWEPML